MIEYFNDLKLPVLKTLSPHEVLKGVKYEDFGIKNKMIEARKLRIQQNQSVNCNVASLIENLNHTCSSHLLPFVE